MELIAVELFAIILLLIQQLRMMQAAPEEEEDLDVANPIGFERVDSGDEFYDEYDEGDFGLPDEDDD